MRPSSPFPLPKISEKPSQAVERNTVARTPRDVRLRKHADYQRVYQAARKQFSPSMTWFLATRQNATAYNREVDGPRVGLTAGKVLGKAHERNRIKRRMREVVRRHFKELPDGIDLILHPRRSVMTMEFVKLNAEVLRIFRQVAGQIEGEKVETRKIESPIRTASSTCPPSAAS